MPEPWSRPPLCRLDELTIESNVLRGNALGDPHERPLWVQLPPGYDDDDRRYPVLYLIQGFTGQIDMWRNRAPLRPTPLERFDAALGDGTIPPAVLVYVDCWTSIGGSQFLDSPATGRYHTYLCDEVVPFVDARYRTIAEPGGRGIAGKSSGGYGAMVTPMLRPDLFGALATHAGDALFEVCYSHDLASAVRNLRARYDGSFERFLDDLRSRPAMGRPEDGELLNAYAMAACYSADEDGTVRFPIDPVTGVPDDDVWARWHAWDPVRMVPRHADALRGLRGIWIDAGTRDEWWLDVGASAFRTALATAGVPDEIVRYELFDAAHGGIEYRYPDALAWLSERLQPTA